MSAVEYFALLVAFIACTTLAIYLHHKGAAGWKVIGTLLVGLGAGALLLIGMVRRWNADRKIQRTESQYKKVKVEQSDKATQLDSKIANVRTDVDASVSDADVALVNAVRHKTLAKSLEARAAHHRDRASKALAKADAARKEGQD